jgi:hypothetical protein
VVVGHRIDDSWLTMEKQRAMSETIQMERQWDEEVAVE